MMTNTCHSWTVAALLMCIANIAVAQCKIAVIAPNGNTIASINRGQIRDRSNGLVATFDGRRLLMPSGRLIGAVDSNGIVRDSRGLKLGRVSRGGTLFNRIDSVVGWIDYRRYRGYKPRCRFAIAAYYFLVGKEI